MYIQLIYILLMILTCFWLVKDRKNLKKYKDISNVNPKDKKLAILILLSVMFMYKIIGYIFNIDFVNFIINKENGITFSFVGLFLLIATSLLIVYIIELIRKNKK